MWPLSLVLLVLMSTPALACALALDVGGVLRASPGGDRVGSDEANGRAATFIVSNALLAGDFRITVARPVIVDAPAGFDRSAPTYVSYTASGLLSSYGSGGYVDHQTSFDVTGLLSALSVIMTLNNRFTSGASGIFPGHYATTTTVTCAPL
ncbi:MAG: hypothetical protein ABI697_10650 [Devosia sp.]